VLGAAWIADFGPQPLLGMVDQFQCPGAGPVAGGGCRLVATQQLNQSGRQLFGGPAGALAFQGVPIAIADAQLLMQVHGGLQGPVGPMQPVFQGALAGAITHNGAF
jgi:hypothetical protein